MIRSRHSTTAGPDPCPEAMRRILMKAMAADPELRYQSAADFGMDLAAFRAGGSVKAASEDLDATRRTFKRPPAVDDETRRTVSDETRRTAPEVSNQPAAVKPVEAVKQEPQTHTDLFYYTTRTVAVLAAISLVWAAWSAVSDYRLYQRGQEFQHDVVAEQITDPDQIWNGWTELSKGNSSSLFLRGPRQAAKEKFVAAANHVIDTYRNNDAQPVYENDWQRAHTMLLHALSLDPDDKPVHGKLRLCEGHIGRINGAAHHSAAELNDALSKLTEAQSLMPQSQDPPLAMARVYGSLKDVDKEAAAFHQAETNGYTLGNRERSQLADGYWDRANRTWWDSRNVRGLPQEKDQIQKAADDYKLALELYQKSAGYGNASARIPQVESSLESVNTRLHQIQEEQQQPGESEEQHRNRVASAIIHLFQAFHDKSTKK